MTTENDAPIEIEVSDPADSASSRSVFKPVALLLIAVLVAATAFFAFQWWNTSGGALTSDQQAAVDAAAEHAVALGTYSHETFDDSVAAVLEGSTPEFAERYGAAAGDLRELVVNGEGSSEGSVLHAGLEGMDGDTATVLVFLDQNVRNLLIEQGRVDATRFLVTVEKIDGRWLLDGAEAK